MQVLDTDRSLLSLAVRADAEGESVISARLPETFGGHWRHVWLVCGMFGLLNALALVMEFAYEFDRYAKPGLMAAGLAFLWSFGTAAAALWCDWRLTSRGNGYG
jgi:hypothetical protein